MIYKLGEFMYIHPDTPLLMYTHTQVRHDQTFQTDLCLVPADHNVSKLISRAIIHCSSGAVWDRFWYCRRKPHIILATLTHSTFTIYVHINVDAIILFPYTSTHTLTHVHTHTS